MLKSVEMWRVRNAKEKSLGSKFKDLPSLLFFFIVLKSNKNLFNKRTECEHSTFWQIFQLVTRKLGLIYPHYLRQQRAINLPQSSISVKLNNISIGAISESFKWFFT